MTPLDRIRAIALVLPGTSERTGGGGVDFLVDGEWFAQVRDDGAVIAVRSDGGERTFGIDDATDWTLVEDHVARSWELTAPAALLEAGGR